MKYFIVAGEPSGDLHASNLIKNINKIDTNSEIVGWGGELMQAENCKILKHYKELAFMGFIEVILNINKIIHNFKIIKKQIINFNPDVIIFIDYPGFNLKLSKFCKQNNFKTVYYISPQVWAWHKSRVKTIKKYIDKMFVILPFEKEFYSNYNYDVEYYGNPLIELINNKKNNFKGKDIFIKNNNLTKKEIIAILPGSRKQEIENMLPQMQKVVQYFPNYQFVIAATSSINNELYLENINNIQISIVYNQTYDLLLSSSAAIVTSGTATLETALLKIPQIVCYKGLFISYIIAKKLIKLNFISLVNIIMDKNVVKELIQNEMNHTNIKQELSKILNDKQHRQNIIEDYDKLSLRLGNGETSFLVASKIFDLISK